MAQSFSRNLTDEELNNVRKRLDVPEKVRAAALYAARDCYISDETLYFLACREIQRLVDSSPENFGNDEFGPPPYFERLSEEFRIMPWYSVFDIIEAIFDQMYNIRFASGGGTGQEYFRDEVNRALRKAKSPWTMNEDGLIQPIEEAE